MTSANGSLHELGVLITGAGRGLGRALVLAFLQEGATVAALIRNKAELDSLGREVAEAWPQHRMRLLLQHGSALDRSCILKAVQSLQQATVALDLLIANAGVFGPRQPFHASDPQAWEEALLNNVLGLSRTCHACIPALQASGRGQILVLGSAIGHGHSSHASAYAASKAMAWSLVKCLSLEFQPLGIAINELIPGPLHTAMNPAADSLPFCRDPGDPAILALIRYLCTAPGRPPSGQSFSLRPTA